RPATATPPPPRPAPPQAPPPAGGERPPPRNRRPVRAVHRRAGDRQRVQRAERPAGPEGALRGPGRGKAARGCRDDGLRRGLHPGPRARHAPARRRGSGRGPAGDAPPRPPLDPRRHPLSAAQAREALMDEPLALGVAAPARPQARWVLRVLGGALVLTGAVLAALEVGR